MLEMIMRDFKYIEIVGNVLNPIRNSNAILKFQLYNGTRYLKSFGEYRV